MWLQDLESLYGYTVHEDSVRLSSKDSQICWKFSKGFVKVQHFGKDPEGPSLDHVPENPDFNILGNPGTGIVDTSHMTLNLCSYIADPSLNLHNNLS